MIRVTWKEDYTYMARLDRALGKYTSQEVQDSAESLVEDIKQHWSGSSPSSAGSPPAIDLGHLDAGTKVDKQGRTLGGLFAAKGEQYTAFVRIDPSSSGRSYAQALETGTEDMAARPFFYDAIDRLWAVYPEQIKDVFAKVRRG